ncbi:MAG TPA: cell division protein FtsQ/DivIB [Burkholderiales bacterium]|nr:cell division protein FtsQ/DivIB [Burkholderiales bacterium]
MWDNHRHLNRLATGLYGIAALLLVYWALIAIVRLPIFPLREMQVSGRIAHTTPEQVRAVIDGRLQGNFFTLDLEAARRSLQKLPWVRHVLVRREWPDRLEIQIEEHVALARWREDALVNTYGELFEAATNEALPVFGAPDETAAEVTRRYLMFSSLLQPLGKRPVQVLLSERRAWQLKLDDGTVLELGRGQIEEKLRRLVAAYPRALERLAGQPQRIDLRYSNGFAVHNGAPHTPGA